MISDSHVPLSRTAELRKSNRHIVFMEIYNRRSVSKEQIKQSLGLSLPTVTQNLNELEQLGVIRKNGVLGSTGGRKANAYAVVRDFRIAIGFFLQKASYSVEAIDLYGDVLFSRSVERPFSDTAEYYRQLGACLQDFIRQNEIDPAAILGVNIALEAIVSPDHTTVTYSEVYRCTGLTRDQLCVNIPFPCRLYHDSHATAEAELWARNDIKNAVIVILNRYMGGSVIIDGAICEGNRFECVMEHMRLATEGPKCYCGKAGCFESFCSTYALERDAGEPLDAFFRRLRSGDESRAALWECYLRHLAIGINNIRMLIDCEFIIGGHLLQYLTEEDFDRLKALIDQECPLRLGEAIISPSKFKTESAAQGAALPLVKEYLQTV